jgi:hypothetical protein
MLQLKLKTWSCSCGYKQDFEPTRANMHRLFNLDAAFPVNDLKEGECPSCKKNKKVGELLASVSDSDCINVNCAEVGEQIGEDADKKPVLAKAEDIKTAADFAELLQDSTKAEEWNVTPWSADGN